METEIQTQKIFSFLLQFICSFWIIDNNNKSTYKDILYSVPNGIA